MKDSKRNQSKRNHFKSHPLASKYMAKKIRNGDIELSYNTQRDFCGFHCEAPFSKLNAA